MTSHPNCRCAPVPRLKGGRQQFFSFGLFVLVDVYGMSVAKISALLIGVRLIGIVSSFWIGGMIDRHSERTMCGG